MKSSVKMPSSKKKNRIAVSVSEPAEDEWDRVAQIYERVLESTTEKLGVLARHRIISYRALFDFVNLGLLLLVLWRVL